MISVIIPVRNEAARLATQLDALSRQTFDGAWEVIVADNGSSDDTIALAMTYADRLPGLQVVDASARRGVSHARNVGVSVSRGDFLLFCDADDVIANQWVERMAAAAEGCDAVGGRLIGFVSATPLAPARASAKMGLYEWDGFYPFPSGANCGVRRSMFDELGGFDERYVGGGDDVEFFWRLQIAGRRVTFVSDAVVMYRERGSARGVARQAFRYGRMDAQLYRDFRDHGMPRRPFRTLAREWRNLVLLAPWYWVDRVRRRRWASHMGRRIGRLVGSVRVRAWYF